MIYAKYINNNLFGNKFLPSCLSYHVRTFGKGVNACG